MYKLKADGVVFYDPSSNDVALQVLSPKAKFELNKAGSLEFTMLPGNVAYNSLQKMKTIITLEDDEDVIFRGRVLETKTDLYNQKEVYCEGEMGYLMDSVVRPYEFEGKATDLFRQLVADHNAQVDGFKQFQVGAITAVTDEDVSSTESGAYCTTFAEIRQMFINPFGGYLRVRMDGGVRYLDYLDEYTEEDGAPISFGVNLMDIEDEYKAGEVFSVLVPLGGYDTKHKDAVTIAEVNGGKDYIENPSAIAKYGRIVKTYKWEELTEPQEILEKGQAQLTKMEEERTLVIKAFDLHELGQGNRIRLGSRVHLGSSPHGLNGRDVCSAVELDIEKPDQSEYTFGIPPETLTDSNASRAKKIEGEMDKLRDWLTVTDTELILAKQDIDGKMVALGLSLADLEAKALLKAAYENDKNAMLTLISNAEQSVATLAAKHDNQFASLELIASELESSALMKAEYATNRAADLELISNAQGSVARLETKYDGQIASLELKTTEQGSLISAKANRTELQTQILRIDAVETEIAGLLKVENLQAAIADLADVSVSQLSVGGTAHCTNLAVHGAGSVDGDLTVTGGMAVDGFDFTTHSHTVTVNSDGTLTLGEVSSAGGSFNIADTQYYKDGVSAAEETGYNRGYGQATPNRVMVNAGYNAINNVYSGSVRVYSNDGTSISFIMSPINASDAYNAGHESGYDTGYKQGAASVDTTSYYNDGWNDCRSNATPWRALVNFYPAGETLYDAYGNVATGPWYKGTETYLYALPAAKS